MHLIFDANSSMTQIWASRESYGWEFFVYGLTESDRDIRHRLNHGHAPALFHSIPPIVS